MSAQNILTLRAVSAAAAAAVPAWQTRAERAEIAAAREQHGQTADAHFKAHRYPACASTLDAAEPFAVAAGDAQALLTLVNERDRARALTFVTQDALPTGGERALATGVRDRLESATTTEARAASAALGVYLRRAEGALPEAKAVGEAAIKGGADSVWLQWQLGSVAIAENRIPDAVTALERVTQEVPTFAAGHHRLGLAYAASGKKGEAVAALQRALELSGRPEARMDLARALLANEQWAEAQPHLERLLSTDSSLVEAIRLLALSHFRQQHFAQAAELYRKAWTQQPEPRTLLSAAIALHSGGQLPAALETLDALMSSARAVPEIVYLRARVLTDLGRADDARTAYTAFLQLAAGQPAEAERVRAAQAALAANP